jgi:hypothetical protein
VLSFRLVQVSDFHVRIAHIKHFSQICDQTTLDLSTTLYHKAELMLLFVGNVIVLVLGRPGQNLDGVNKNERLLVRLLRCEMPVHMHLMLLSACVLAVLVQLVCGQLYW